MELGRNNSNGVNMEPSEQADRFCDDLDKLIDLYRREYELTYTPIISALEFKKHTLIQEAIDEYKKGEDDKGE
jgi:hypothetical protein